jgi:WD40 repeat protein/tRNA A-37 threonylcarbamoyl transferase component Bud32
LSSCPSLDELEAGAPHIAAHVEQCPSCKLVMEIIEHRHAKAEPDCSHFEALLALRDSDTLRPDDARALDRHLASCEDCQAVAATEAPPDDGPPADDLDLPMISRSAYVFGKEIGRGGMGRILAARDRRIGRPVAIKEILDLSPSMAARFEREARLTARLQHPGIVPVYEIGQFSGGRAFYAMPRLPGTTLREAIAHAHSLPERLALLPVVIAAAEAVAYAHSQRIVHRDLTPANILIGKFGETVVIDWGIAKDLNASETDVTDPGPFRRESASLTAAGAVVGTAAYMPPEQAAGEPIDERVDVYALGAILYHLLAGHAPYRGATTEAVLAQLRAGPPPPAAGPPVLASIVARAMGRDKANRYRDAEELALELKRFQTGKLVATHRYSLRQLWWRWLRMRRGIIVTGTILLAGMIALSIAEYRRIFRERDRANTINAELLEDQGRQELLAAHPSRALAYLSSAYSQGRKSPALRFMLAEAARDVEALQLTVEGDDIGELGQVPLSHDGHRLATVREGRVRVWDAKTGAVVRTIRGPAGYVDRPIFAPDGRVLVRADTAVLLWDVGSEEPVRAFDHGAEISTALFSPDGARLVTVSDVAHDVKMWETATGQLLFTLDGDNPYARQLRALFDHDGYRLAIRNPDGAVHIHDARSGKELATIGKPSDGLLACSFSPDGDFLATGTRSGRILIWDVSGVPNSAWTGHEGVVVALDWSPDGSRVVSSAIDGTARLWNVHTRTAIAIFRHGGGPVYGSLSADGQRVATRGFDGRVQLWSARDGSAIGLLESGRGTFMGFGRSANQLVTSDDDGKVRLWDASGRLVRSLDGFEPQRKAELGMSPDGSRIFVGSDDSRVGVWNSQTGKLLFASDGLDTAQTEGSVASCVAVVSGAHVRLRGFAQGGTTDEFVWPKPVRRALASPDCGRVLIQTEREPPQLADPSGRPIATLRRNGPHVTAQFSPKGRYVLVRNEPHGPNELWDARTGHHVASLGADFNFVVFSPDETLAATNPPLRIWDTYGSDVFQFRDPHTRMVFSANSKWFAATKMLGGVTVYDTRTWKPAATVEPHAVGVAAELSPDGTFLITGSTTGISRIWDWRAGKELARIEGPPPPRYVTMQAGGGGVWLVEPTIHDFIHDGNVLLRTNSDGLPISIWRFQLETRSAEAIADIVERRVPWRLEGGRLVPR